MLGLLYCESLLRWIEIAAISLVNADVVYYPLLIDIQWTHQTMKSGNKLISCKYHVLLSCTLMKSLTSSSIGAAHASRVYAKKVSGGYDLI